MRAESLTEQAKAWHAQRLASGALALDGTLGNGHDALFLAGQVGADGHLFGFDCQPAAVEASRARLEAAGMLGRTTLYLAGHEDLLQWLPDHAVGAIDAAMFNLGYLPGGDKSLVTRPETTVQALTQTWRVLRNGARLSLLVYTGHRGGEDELTAMQAWLRGLGPSGRNCRRIAATARHSPVLFLLTR